MQSFGSKRSLKSYAGGKSAICQRLAERYRALLEAKCLFENTTTPPVRSTY
jgi:hypothetical protein